MVESQAGVATTPPATEHESVPALRRAVRILDLLRDAQVPPTAAEIARFLSLPRSSTHGLISVMAELGLIERTGGPAGGSGAFGHVGAAGGSHGYRLGARLLDWANGAAANRNLISEFGAMLAERPELSAFTITLSVIEGPEVVYVANRDTERGIGIHFRIGMRLPAVYTASGKALLAAMSESAFQEWLAFYPPMTWPEPVTAHSVRSVAALVEEVRVARRQGYAVDDEQIHEGLWCFASAVHTAGGGVAAALGLSMPKSRTAQADAELGAAALAAARMLSARLGHRPA